MVLGTKVNEIAPQFIRNLPLEMRPLEFSKVKQYKPGLKDEVIIFASLSVIALILSTICPVELYIITE